jgi:hypothetical protein
LGKAPYALRGNSIESFFVTIKGFFNPDPLTRPMPQL